jgi:hypothetical protein
MNEHEKLFIDSFVIKPKQDRFREGLGSTKHRQKLVSSLDHSADLRYELALEIPPSEQTASEICSLLRSKGAPGYCYAISSNSDIDEKEMDLMSALEDVIGYGDGTFLSCIPGKLGYYESGELGNRLIFEKP